MRERLLHLAGWLLIATGLGAYPAYALSSPPASVGEARVRFSINDNWRFYPSGLEFAQQSETNDAGWQQVNLPHTWNAFDPFDDAENYRRGVSWYRKHLVLADGLRDKRIFLQFEGVNQVASVYVNGAYIGTHRGGYTAFTMEATEKVRFDGQDNVIAVQVDNSHNDLIPPLSVGYALYGGIYRDVWVVATDRVHLTTKDHGSNGVWVSTPVASQERAEVLVRGKVVNTDSVARTVRIVNTILDDAGRAVTSGEMRLSLAPQTETPFKQAELSIGRPRLWSPDQPYLYRVRTEVIDGDRRLDVLHNPLGIRWFSFDPKNGFSLNGSRLQLRGTNRHQDYQGLGSALSNEQHLRDLKWVKDMGANFVRLAHYPQDPAVLEAADRLGLLVWEEIPLLNYATRSPEFGANAAMMLREMIRQHRNHPSVILWGSMNEIYLWSPEAYRLKEHTDMTYGSEINALARSLDSLIRAEDPSRYSTMAIHGSSFYDKTGLDTIPQVLGLNIYHGWYSGKVEGFGSQLDSRHKRKPNQVLFVSEYGAGVDTRLNAAEMERFDHSGSYMRYYHEAYLRQISERPWLGGTAIWNEFDFSQPNVGSPLPHMNQKGMLTWDRKPKDVYYLYKANWNPEPMVYIASHDWTTRYDVGAGTQPVDVYSNHGRVEMFVNGKSAGVRTPDEVRKASWEVMLAPGKNLLEARALASGAPVADVLELDYVVVPENLSSKAFTELAVNVGSNAQYQDDDGQLWVADRPYRRGGFGYVGGKAAMFDKDLAMRGTHQVPLFMTYREGLDAYRMDVPDGDYEVRLLFAEAVERESQKRVFALKVNGASPLADIDLAAMAGLRQATALTIQTTATDGDGITVSFTPREGEPVLSGIYVRKL